MAARKQAGRGEPPLTADEVVAAIRGWIPEQHPVKPEVLKIYQRIAETRMLPPGSRLDTITRWTLLNRYGYNYRIRDRKIRSWMMTEEEKGQLEERQRRLQQLAEAPAVRAPSAPPAQ